MNDWWIKWDDEMNENDDNEMNVNEWWINELKRESK